jgi:hypothetical protein
MLAAARPLLITSLLILVGLLRRPAAETRASAQTADADLIYPARQRGGSEQSPSGFSAPRALTLGLAGNQVANNFVQD